MTSKKLLQAITPPFLWTIGKDAKRRMMRSVDYCAYAPKGWETEPGTDSGQDFWTNFLPQAPVASDHLLSGNRSGQPVPASASDDLEHAIFGYALALAGRDQRKISVLDYGGFLGDFYQAGRQFVPWLELEYHCKELPAIAEAGQALNPAVTWHTDDQCFAQTYDLVMFCGSLQYLRNWHETLSGAAQGTRRYLLLLGLPTVRNVPGFVTTQRQRAAVCLHHSLNRDEVVGTVERAGLRLVREFQMGAYPPVANAPEQPACIGLLFQRD